jgi:23S rRNA pseudouridine2457 synthase
LISHPRHQVNKTYLVQVELDKRFLAKHSLPADPDPSLLSTALARAVQPLQEGILLPDGSQCRPASVALLPTEPPLWPRLPPVRHSNCPKHWLELTLKQGINRQVRRMAAAVDLPALRLVRVAVGPLGLDGLLPGQHRQLSPAEVADFADWLQAYTLEN